MATTESSSSGLPSSGRSEGGVAPEQIPSLDGRIFLITGANSGLGLESALAIAASGGLVVLACRNKERGSKALESVTAAATGAEPQLLALDLSDLESVERAAVELSDRVPRLDVLMNNAGVMALPERRTAQGHEMQFGTNHLGHFALTGRLLSMLLKSTDPRVVTTSSQMHRIGKMAWGDLDWTERRYMRWPAYGQSKLANLLFAFELARRAASTGTKLRSMAAHPGYASTGLQEAGAVMAGRRLTARVMNLGNSLVGQPARLGAMPQIFAATNDDVSSGAYYGPDGFAEMRGAPTEVKSSAAARSHDEAHRLWNVSETMTGVSYDWSDPA